MSEGFATAPLPAGTAALVQGAASGTGAGGAGHGGTVSLPNPPPALAALGAGQTVRAVVVGRNGDGKVVVETRFGQLALDLSTNPQRGAVLQFQIQRAGDPVQLRLVPPVASRPQGQGQPAATSPAGASRPPQAGDTITLQRLSPGSTLAEGAPRQVRIAAMAAPGTRLAVPAQPAGGTPPAPTMTVRVVPPPPGSPAGTPVIVQGDAGRFALPGITGLAPGTRLLLSLTGNMPPPGPLSASPSPLTALGSAWAALDDAHAALHSADASAGTHVANAAIPQTGPRLTAGILFFLTALAKGRIEDWLGQDAVRALDGKENRNLLSRLTEDFSRLARTAAEPAQGDWRTLMLPLLHDGMLQQIRLYLRDHTGGHGSDGEDGEERPGTRFVVEAALSRLGPLQLDGLVRPGQFDLMVRSHAELPRDVRDGITELFAEANRSFDARGRIGFQVEDPFMVRPDTESETHATGVMA